MIYVNFSSLFTFLLYVCSQIILFWLYMCVCIKLYSVTIINIIVIIISGFYIILFYLYYIILYNCKLFFVLNYYALLSYTSSSSNSCIIIACRISLRPYKLVTSFILMFIEISSIAIYPQTFLRNYQAIFLSISLVSNLFKN